MKRLLVVVPVWLIVLAPFAMAQEKPTAKVRLVPPALPEVAPAPEERDPTWLYEQYAPEFLTPEAAVRRKAEERSAQRRHRIASRKWFGFSNARPTAAADVIHGDYSPRWTSGNANYPFRWSGYGSSVVVVRPSRSESSR